MGLSTLPPPLHVVSLRAPRARGPPGSSKPACPVPPPPPPSPPGSGSRGLRGGHGGGHPPAHRVAAQAGRAAAGVQHRGAQHRGALQPPPRAAHHRGLRLRRESTHTHTLPLYGQWRLDKVDSLLKGVYFEIEITASPRSLLSLLSPSLSPLSLALSLSLSPLSTLARTPRF